MCASATNFKSMGTIIVSIIALLLFAYLFAAMIRPEKF